MPAAPPTTLDPDPRADAPPTSGSRRAALVGVFVLMLLALLARTVFALWEPVFDGTLRYDDVRERGAAYWSMNLYLGGPGYAVSWLAGAALMALLARGRSAAITLVGACLAGLGGLVFALTITAEVLPFVWAADPGVMTEVEGRALFEVFNAQLGLLVPTIIGASVAIALGVLLVLVAGLLTGALPRWFGWAGIAYVVVFVVLPTEQLGRPVVVAGYLLQVALVIGLGWFGLRAGLSSAQTTPRGRPSGSVASPDRTRRTP